MGSSHSALDATAADLVLVAGRCLPPCAEPSTRRELRTAGFRRTSLERGHRNPSRKRLLT